MWQEFFDSVDGLAMDAREDILEPNVGVNVVLFAGVDERVDHGGALGGFMASCKEVVFPAHSNRSDSVFHQIIVNFQPTTSHIHRFPPQVVPRTAR